MAFKHLDDLIVFQVVVEIQLNACVVLEHLEPDRVPATDKLLLRIDANIEIIEEQIIVGTIAAILTAEDVGVGWWLWSGRGLRRWGCAGTLLFLSKER